VAQQGGPQFFQPVSSDMTANVAFVSDYIFRGTTQSNGRPAIQAGWDYERYRGFVGLWASSASTELPLEIDLYGSYGPHVGENTRLELKVTGFIYPHDSNANSVEGKFATFLYEAAGVAYHYDFTNNRSYFEFGIRYDFRLPLALTGKTGVRINSGESPVYDWEARLVYSLKESFVFGGGATGHEIEGNKLFIGVQSTMTLFTN
jgi:uncharacterized protein (TIGR02001 family)